MNKNNRLLIYCGGWAVLLCMLLPESGHAAPRYARSTGNWTGVTWSATGCGAGTGAAVPAAGDDVTICDGFTVTLNANTAALGSLNVESNATLRFDGTARNLSVAGNITVDGTLTVQNLTATHSLTLGGNITNNGTLNLALDGNSLCNTTFNGTGPQVIGGSSPGLTRFNNITVTNSLTINKTDGPVTQTGAATVGGNLRIQSGSLTQNGTLSVTGTYSVEAGGTHTNANTLTVGGLTTVGGTLNITSTTGTRSINGGMTINAGGTFNNNTVAEPVTIGGDFINNGTFNAGNNTYTFNSAGQWAGSSGLTFGTGTVTVSAARTNNTTATFGGTLAISGAVTVTNNATASVTGAITGTVAGSTWTNAANSTLNITGELLATGTLNASASGNTIEFRATGNQTIKQASGNQYFHLVFSNAGTDSFPTAGSTQNILGNLTINAGANLSAATNDNIINVSGSMVVDGIYQASNVAGRTLSVTGDFEVSGTFTGNVAPANFAGNFTRTGTFTSSTGLYTFNGSSLQTLTGASAFTNVTVNNAAGLLLADDMTMTTAAAGTLTLTDGTISTGANALIVPRPCNNVATVVRTNGHVIGNLRKAIPAGASTCTFEVGSGVNYAPAVLEFVVGTGAGDITASTAGTAHPQAGHVSSGIDPVNKLNRYWTITNNTVTLPGAGYSATFNFINGTPVDVAAGVAANFIVESWNGAMWAPTTLNATCTATPGTNLCKRVNGLTTFGDFWMGEAKPVPPTPPDSFNSVEVGAAVNGRIFTKLRDVNFQLDIVAVLGGVLYNTFNEQVQIDLVTGGSGGANCGGGSPTRVAGPVDVTLVNGRVTAPAFNVSTAYPDVRVRIGYPTVAPTVTTCSSDNFTIRPGVLTITSTNATNTGMSGTPAIKTGVNFNLTASGGAGYTGAPSNNTTGALPGPPASKVSGTPVAGAVGGSFTVPASDSNSGSASGNFFYSEVGHFGLLADAVIDTTFVIAADQSNADCVASRTDSSPDPSGKYGCWIGSGAVSQSTGISGFGRFIPDNFTVTYNIPVIAPACAGFSYAGQMFNYTTVPVMTIGARNGTNNGLTNEITVNYAGSYSKFTNAQLALAPYDTKAGRYQRFDALGGGNTPDLDRSGLPDPLTADPVISTFTAGVGTFTFSGSTGFGFTRSATTPSAPFDADIVLRLNVIDADNVAFAENPAAFGTVSAGGGMLFSDGIVATTTDKQIRFGRLRIGGGSGSQVLPLRLPVEAQHWNGTAFATNTLDSCTTLTTNNVGLGNYSGSLNAGETTPTIVNSPLQAGRSAIRLSAPGSTNPGSVDVALNLGSGAAADACAGFAPTATAGNKTHLRGAWCNPPGTYTKDPSAKARFGVTRGADQSIYRREQ